MIAGEALGPAKRCEGADYVLAGHTRLAPKRGYGLLINMGGSDETVVSAAFRAA